METSKRQRRGSVGAPGSVQAGDGDVAAAFCERLRRCHEENGNDTSAPESYLDGAPPLPAHLRAGAKQAASLLQVAIEELDAAIVAAAALADGADAPLASTADQGRELIGYAHRLSFTTSAPPGFIPGQTPLMHFKPPAPQDLQLRSSALHAFQREFEERRRADEAAAAYAAPAPEPTAAPAKKEETEAAAVPTNLADILSKLPPMPAGWKPGDAIPGLPPALTAAMPAEAAAAVAAAPPAAPAPAPAKPQPLAPAAVEVEAPPVAPVAAPFSFALNPDMEMEFGASSSDESDSDDD